MQDAVETGSVTAAGAAAAAASYWGPEHQTAVATADHSANFPETVFAPDQLQLADVLNLH